MKLLSIVILTCNQLDLTLRCLDSLSPLASRPEVEIILVDNGSTDGTHRVIPSRHPHVRLIRLSTNTGVAPGRNTGLRAANGEYLMILDNDTYVDGPEPITRMLGYLRSHPSVGLVAPRLVSPAGLTQSSFRPYPGILSKLRNVLTGKRRSSIARTTPADSPSEPFYVIGAAQMFRRDVYNRTSGLDENIIYGPEDADFCMAVRALGLKVVYLPSATITHDWQRSTSSLSLTPATRNHIKGLIYFYRKHRRWWK